MEKIPPAANVMRGRRQRDHKPRLIGVHRWRGGARAIKSMSAPNLHADRPVDYFNPETEEAIALQRHLNFCRRKGQPEPCPQSDALPT